MGHTLRSIVGRTSRVVVPLVLLGVLAACQPVAPPPTNQPGPTLTAAQATPVVVAGESVTASVLALHAEGISHANLSLRGPHGARLLARADGSGVCETSPSVDFYVQSAPGIEAEVSASCTMPAFSSNGTWELTLTVWPRGSYVPAEVVVPFEVVGGVDDQGAPVVTALVGPPPTAAAGSTFPLAFRIEDGHLRPGTDTSPANFARRDASGQSTAGFYCVDHVTTWVSPTVIETSMTCNVPLGQSPGPYVLELFPIEDTLGLVTNATFGPVQITP